ncbi:helix-turn-helix domain-containing protein [Singulisphaera sp. PoT]|uniref:helix-turn-helix domain-containing protein n=1 Tax=Singulisphaera sp. PoT TaxID=3411797 RepID=UPI003BF55904
MTDASAGSRGRHAPVPAAGKPTCDEVYRFLADKFVRKLKLDRQEDLGESVARRFRDGPARICCQAIGGWIDGKLSEQSWSQQELAGRIGVDRSAVARWTTGGSISLSHLVLVLIEFRSDFDDLPFPIRHQLALEGYLAALTHVRARLDPSLEPGPIDHERFWCLYHLFAEPYWERALRARNREQLEAEAARILKRAEESLGYPPRSVLGVDGIKKLVEEWAAAWIICLNLVPRDWAIR